ncbi:hypothetical protein AB0L85_31940 [Streptomyces sp. NPDC052051]|uniref:deazapurine DNA modification protein DpdA family protein n=1 Tax=Streptomyces sp. NPDC052051 TaxID=3154649 RepID=UPI003421D2C6
MRKPGWRAGGSAPPWAAPAAESAVLGGRWDAPSTARLTAAVLRELTEAAQLAGQVASLLQPGPWQVLSDHWHPDAVLVLPATRRPDPEDPLGRRVSWALREVQGAFSELDNHGGWTIGPHAYVRELHQFRDGIGRLVWASPQDWMCSAVVRSFNLFQRGSVSRRHSRLAA